MKNVESQLLVLEAEGTAPGENQNEIKKRRGSIKFSLFSIGNTFYNGKALFNKFDSFNKQELKEEE
jgi:hypothetical protein